MITSSFKQQLFYFFFSLAQQTATPRGATTPKQPSPQTESVPAIKIVPIKAPPQSSVDTVKSVEKSSELITIQAVEPTSNPVEILTPAEIVTITETVTSVETHENKTDSFTSESETVSNVDTETIKLSEPENSEMTGIIDELLQSFFPFYFSSISIFYC